MSRWSVSQGCGNSHKALRMSGNREQLLSGWGAPGMLRPSMRSEAERQRSFRAWPRSCPQLSPVELARSGFYYLGPGDRVQCFSCGGVLRSWEPGDRPDTEHRKFFPSCPFLQQQQRGPGATDSVDGQVLGQLSGEEPDRTWEPVYPEMSEEQVRLGSFSTWPLDVPGSPEVLAGAGFFYTGHRDHVKCFHCDGGLQNWEQGDDPWTEHAKWFPMCDFLLQVKGEAFIRSVQESLFSSPEPSPESLGSYDYDRSLASSTESVSVPRAPTPGERSEPPKVSGPPLSTEEQLQRLKEERMCKVCMDKDVSMLFVPCGHLVVCTECAPNLRHCPICRAAIRGSVRAFMS
uniref:Baculoviral IAP repeat-containing protein 7-B n=1 Tax=Xenopus laevis TaxID=8355 RepID=BIR7B_XENLA|nr:RecName: Full=Baculoviral IAP repeat-containing protein 7-B; AltName: Full=E3 ubiquitin-protein ligase EIAP-B; AltName: Full=Embryonic/Egg IAP-B; Short=EIAP/XLX-B; AltName: Full=RING-type E3 ubiquitin transferase EIAP-B [Xenopus laevis]